MKADSDELNVSNFCACFIDLLGQKNALAGQGIMPELTTEKGKSDFLQVVKNSVGVIGRLQVAAQNFRQGKAEASLIRESLNEEDKKNYDEMKKVVAKQQRWSDGLVYYCSLDTSSAKCPMSAVLEIFMLAGTLCFLGIANKQPIRGAIDIAWGVELHENELYGAVVANSYELESKIAQYPRIVVGHQTMHYLNAYLEHAPNTSDKLGLYNRNCAQLCKSMTSLDKDGYYIIDYLGKSFTKYATSSISHEVFILAYNYILEQIEIHKKNKDTKLLNRYEWLIKYFNKNKKLHS